MKSLIATLIVPAEGYFKNFLKSLDKTDLSFWKNVKTDRETVWRQSCKLYHVTFTVKDKDEVIDYFVNDVFGGDGILTKDGWLALIESK